VELNDKKSMKFKGFWTIPTDKSSRHYGELSISKTNNISLTLFSNYSYSEIETKIGENISTLYGTTHDGTLLTVSSAYSKRGRGSGVYKRKIKYKYCLVGEHRLINEESIDICKIELSNLLGLFSIETLSLDLSDGRKTIIQKISSTKDFELDLIAGIKRYSSTASSKIPTSKYASLKMQRSKPVKLFELVKEVNYLQFLLSIITQGPVFILKFYIPKHKQRFKEYVEESKLYIYNNPYSNRKTRHEIKTIRTRNSVKLNLNAIIAQWFENKSKWESIGELLLNGTFNNRSNETSNFLNIVTSIESWHRINNEKYDKDSLQNYELLKSQISNNVLKKWFSNKKNNVAFKSLPDRLREYCEKDQLNLIRDKQKFISKCVNQRNYIAHNLLEEEQPATYLEIYTMTLILRLLLEQLILFELNLDTKSIQYLLLNGETYKRLENVRNINKELDI
jgi:hypothetical protein